MNGTFPSPSSVLPGTLSPVTPLSQGSLRNPTLSPPQLSATPAETPTHLGQTEIEFNPPHSRHLDTLGAPVGVHPTSGQIYTDRPPATSRGTLSGPVVDYSALDVGTGGPWTKEWPLYLWTKSSKPPISTPMCIQRTGRHL